MLDVDGVGAVCTLIWTIVSNSAITVSVVPSRRITIQLTLILLCNVNELLEQVCVATCNRHIFHRPEDLKGLVSIREQFFDGTSTAPGDGTGVGQEKDRQDNDTGIKSMSSVVPPGTEVMAVNKCRIDGVY